MSITGSLHRRITLPVLMTYHGSAAAVNYVNAAGTTVVTGATAIVGAERTEDELGINEAGVKKVRVLSFIVTSDTAQKEWKGLISPHMRGSILYKSETWRIREVKRSTESAHEIECKINVSSRETRKRLVSE